MENNNEITLSEAKRVTAELKASILKLDALNQDVANNIQLLEEANTMLKGYMSILSRFNFQTEHQMAENFGVYISFISKQLDKFSKNSNLKRLENIVLNSNNIINFSVAKLVASITVCIGAFYILTLIKG